MTDRVRIDGFRVPRRIQRGEKQRPHPVTQRREDAEHYKAWVAAGGYKQMFDVFCKCYGNHVIAPVPLRSEAAISRLASKMTWVESPPLGRKVTR